MKAIEKLSIPKSQEYPLWAAPICSHVFFANTVWTIYWVSIHISVSWQLQSQATNQVQICNQNYIITVIDSYWLAAAQDGFWFGLQLTCKSALTFFNHFFRWPFTDSDGRARIDACVIVISSVSLCAGKKVCPLKVAWMTKLERSK